MKLQVVSDYQVRSQESATSYVLPSCVASSVPRLGKRGLSVTWHMTQFGAIVVHLDLAEFISSLHWSVKGGNWTMQFLRRARGAFLVASLVATGALAAGCGSSASTPSGTPATSGISTKPMKIFPAPAGLIAAGQPQPDGTMWLLAGTSSAKTLTSLNVATGKLGQPVPASSNASSLAQGQRGPIAIGLATPTGGAVQFANPLTGAVTSSVPVPAQVRQVSVGVNGTTFYVLNGAPGGAANVAIVSSTSGAVGATVPVSSSAVSVVPNPDGSQLFVLQPTGVVQVVSVQNGTILGHFPVGATGVQLALSSDGTTLYAMKSTAAGCNVGVVNVVSQQVTTVMGAPAGCVGLVPSPGGTTIFDAVGLPTVGNIQEFQVAS